VLLAALGPRRDLLPHVGDGLLLLDVAQLSALVELHLDLELLLILPLLPELRELHLLALGRVRAQDVVGGEGALPSHHLFGLLPPLLRQLLVPAREKRVSPESGFIFLRRARRTHCFCMAVVISWYFCCCSSSRFSNLAFMTSLVLLSTSIWTALTRSSSRSL
jgi:hypothetical protein